MKRKNLIHIPPSHAGQPLLDYLAQRFTYLSRQAWQEELAAGRLFLNGAAASAGIRLAAGDELAYQPAPFSEPPVEFGYRVLYEDGDLLAVDKPAPLPCHPGGRYFAHTLWARLREELGLEEVLFVNRLDRETSGVVLIAKHREALRSCQAQFAGREVEKRYLVLVEGAFPEAERMAAGWLAPDRGSAVRKKVRFLAAEERPEGGRECSTVFRLLARAAALSLVEARPWTGRCHQIRATLLGLGFPVVGDKLYGVDERFFLRFLEDALSPTDWARLRLERQALHAAGLRFRHPADGRELSITAPLPAAMAEVFPELPGDLLPG